MTSSSREIFADFGMSVMLIVQKNEHKPGIVSQEYAGGLQLNMPRLAVCVTWRLRRAPEASDNPKICC